MVSTSSLQDSWRVPRYYRGPFLVSGILWYFAHVAEVFMIYCAVCIRTHVCWEVLYYVELWCVCVCVCFLQLSIRVSGVDVRKDSVLCICVSVFVWTRGCVRCVCASGWCCVTELLSAACSCVAVARGLPDNPSALCKCAVICAAPAGMHGAFKQGRPACKTLITAAQREIIV